MEEDRIRRPQDEGPRKRRRKSRFGEQPRAAANDSVTKDNEKTQEELLSEMSRLTGFTVAELKAMAAKLHEVEQELEQIASKYVLEHVGETA